LVADEKGDLFGTTWAGAGHSSTVFEIAKTPTGYASAPTTLGAFSGSNGEAAGLQGDMIVDAEGDLFGTDQAGGANGVGEVFEIAKTPTGYASTPTTLVSFNYADGFAPNGGLLADANGDLFGTNQLGGAHGQGTMFEIAKTASGYASAPTTVSFSWHDGTGIGPNVSLIADANGDLFGTTGGGGSLAGGLPYGTVFEIAKTAAGYASIPTTLATFYGPNGSQPVGGLIADAAGDLFGVTERGGAGPGLGGDGTVFEIKKTLFGYTGPTTLASFDGADGGLRERV
jgi:hypothetical protein